MNFLQVWSTVTFPNYDNYAPCYCYDYEDQGQFLGLYCSNLNLNNTQMERILSAFTNSSSPISPLIHIDLTQNQLTTIPARLAELSELNFVDLRFNRIHSIESKNAFIAPSNTNELQLILQGNDVNIIETGAFQGPIFFFLSFADN